MGDDRGCLVLSATVAAVLLGGGLGAQVPHDECTGALAIGSGITSGSNFGATSSMPTGSCGNMGSDVWYLYNAQCSGFVEATFCQPGAASFDTVLAIFDASASCPMLSQIACNDDTCLLRSKALFPVSAGNAYLVCIGGFAGLQGTFTISLTCHQSPPEDECIGAIPLAPATNGPFSNQFATDGLPPASACAAGFADLWFTFSPTCSGTYRMETCGGYDTVLSVRGACAGSTELACNDDGSGPCSPGSAVQIDATAGATYIVRVAGATPVRGSFNIVITRLFLLSYASQLGVGSVGFTIGRGYPNGIYLNAITLNAGTFPNGPFYGLDMPYSEVLAEIDTGYPFVGPLDACGDSTFPPVVAPFLSGVTLYSVGLSIDAALALTIINTSPVAYTIP